MAAATKNVGGSERDSQERPQVAVAHAFSLGWNLCILYSSGERPTWEEPAEPPKRLPSPSLFSEAEHSLIRLGQVKSAIDRLTDRFPTRDGAESPFSPASTQIEALVPRAPGVGGGGSVKANLCQAHLALTRALSEADARLAKAYHLGCDLAFVCHAPHDLDSLREEFDRKRIAEIGEPLADLTSLFPDHSCRAVRLSCAEWRRWLQEPKLSIAEAGDADSEPPEGIERARARARKPRDLVWSKDGEEVQRSLVRQGEMWRALLSGEKPGTAMLELQDYFSTGARALKHAVRLLRGVWIAAIAAILLLAFGSFLLVRDDGAFATAAGLVGVAGSLGITWKGIFGSLGPVVAQIQGPVWGAALDEEIAIAITCLPAGARELSEKAKLAAPAAGPQPRALIDGCEPEAAEAA